MAEDGPIALVTLTFDTATWTLAASVSGWVLGTAAGCLLVIGIWRWKDWAPAIRAFEIDQAEIGVGRNKFRFKPNLTDRQVAYAIWVELSTRKIGLPIDLEHDVVTEIYDSWYNFFSVTRELIKSVPVTQVKRESTQAIIRLSIEVLNEGLRPHLTKWQARFRQWYDREIKRYQEDNGKEIIDPQQIQAKFPNFNDLKTDIEKVNRSLILYRNKMQELVLKGE